MISRDKKGQRTGFANESDDLPELKGTIEDRGEYFKASSTVSSLA